jgi:hypothetical protein
MEAFIWHTPMDDADAFDEICLNVQFWGTNVVK